MSILCKLFGHYYKANLSFAKLSELGIGTSKLKAEKLEVVCKRCHVWVLTALLVKETNTYRIALDKKFLGNIKFFKMLLKTWNTKRKR